MRRSAAHPPAGATGATVAGDRRDERCGAAAFAAVPPPASSASATNVPSPGRAGGEALGDQPAVHGGDRRAGEARVRRRARGWSGGGRRPRDARGDRVAQLLRRAPRTAAAAAVGEEQVEIIGLTTLATDWIFTPTNRSAVPWCHDHLARRTHHVLDLLTCGTQYPRSAQPPERCRICDDDRQHVGWDGQRWTTHDDLAAELHVRIEPDDDLLGVGIARTFAIPQRALLVPSADAGNVLWDCISVVTAERRRLNDVGGVDAIAISHPHFYASMVEWSDAFGGVPILSTPPTRSGSAVGHRRCGRGTVTASSCRRRRHAAAPARPLPGQRRPALAAAPGGRAALLAGDSLHVAGDRRHVTVMHSVPNYIPVGARTIVDLQRRLAGIDVRRPLRLHLGPEHRRRRRPGRRRLARPLPARRSPPDRHDPPIRRPPGSERPRDVVAKRGGNGGGYRARDHDIGEAAVSGRPARRAAAVGRGGARRGSRRVARRSRPASRGCCRSAPARGRRRSRVTAVPTG